MNVQEISTGTELLLETTGTAELSFWQKLMRLAISPEAQRDLLMYVLLMVFLCAVGKVVYDIKEERRLKKEFAEYQQRRADEE